MTMSGANATEMEGTMSSTPQPINNGDDKDRSLGSRNGGAVVDSDSPATAVGSAGGSSVAGDPEAAKETGSSSGNDLPSIPADMMLPQLLLIPRPSTSPDDPLNWSWRKKHAVLLSLIPGCLLTDWTLTWGTTVFEMQAPEW